MTERITSGLRTWTSDHFGVGDWRYESIMESADRIDAALAERYVELPKDADGEYIHIGDRMENNERVARIVLTDGSWEPSVYLSKLPNFLNEHFCHEISHYHAPTVEDVLREMLDKWGEMPANMTNEAIVTEYAAKLRLAGE